MRPLRVVSLNLWNDRNDPEKRLEVAIQGLRALQADVIGLQEVCGASPIAGNQAEKMARALEMHVVYDAVESHAGPVGNAILSRFPVRAHDTLVLPSGPEDPRHALSALLDTPDGPLPFFTCHLSWQPWHSPRREAQVVAVDDFVKAHVMVEALPPIVTGDFNAPPDSSIVFFLTGHMSLAGKGTYYRDAWARRHPHEDGYTWSARNPHAVRWIERDRRIDYVFVGPMHPSGWGAILDAQVVLDLPGAHGVYASDHFAIYAEIGLAASEEMAV